MRFELAGQMAPSVIDPVPDTPSNLLWEDQFNGLEGTAPDSSAWVIGTTVGETWDHWCRCKPENVFLDGEGHLVLRIKRDTAGPNGLPYSGGWLATFNAWAGYPAPNIKKAFSLPFAYETRFLFPNVEGAHFGCGWLQQIDVDEAGSINEVDVGESRSTFPTKVGFYKHRFVAGVDAEGAGVEVDTLDARTNWQTVRCEVRVDSTKYFLNGVQVTTQPGSLGSHGLEASCAISDDAWQSGGGSPDPEDPGPWDQLIDYVRFVRLF